MAHRQGELQTRRGPFRREEATTERSADSDEDRGSDRIPPGWSQCEYAPLGLHGRDDHRHAKNHPPTSSRSRSKNRGFWTQGLQLSLEVNPANRQGLIAGSMLRFPQAAENPGGQKAGVLWRLRCRTSDFEILHSLFDIQAKVRWGHGLLRMKSGGSPSLPPTQNISLWTVGETCPS